MKTMGLYIHIPFCDHRCNYCDFTTYAGSAHLIPAYVAALCQEIKLLGRAAENKFGHQGMVDTVYFGGGTPSMLTAGDFSAIMKALDSSFYLSNPEMTLEANPGTLSKQALVSLRRLGFNRLSLGVQTIHGDELGLLGRQHSFLDVCQAVEWAVAAGFENLNLDLIYGIPKQSLQSWQTSLDTALALHPHHLSLYALKIEAGTPLYDHIIDGGMPEPDPDLVADMYDWAVDFLAGRGFLHYEISNWAQSANPKDIKKHVQFACRHNMHYWLNQAYLGFGVAAHGSYNGLRIANVMNIIEYLRRMSNAPFKLGQFPISPATKDKQQKDQHEQMQETMILGLRLVREGVSDLAFQSQYGVSITEAFPTQVQELLHLGLVEWCSSDGSEALRLTRKAYFISNQVFIHFVD